LNAKRAQPSNKRSVAKDSLLRRPTLFIASAILVFGCFAFGGLWKRFGPGVVNSPEFLLSVSQIVLTPEPPHWVQDDFSADVFRRAAGGTQQLSILEEELTSKIAQTFETHPWVEKVVDVTKHNPAQVRVRLIYRQPVAMVEIVDASQPGLFVVDRSGVLLPFEDGDLTLEELRDFPRINAGDTPPASPIAGVPWQDNRVLGAALVAAEIGPERWATLGLYRINVLPSRDKLPPAFTLSSQDEKIQVEWGHAPGSEQPRESPAKDKIERLIAALAQTDSANKPLVIDLRQSTKARTARRPQ